MEEKKYINYKETKISYILNSMGNKRVLVMVHGFGMDNHERGNFDKLAKELLKIGYDSIRIDMIGHGESEGDSRELTVKNSVEIVEQILSKYNYKDVSLLGSSHGGSVVSVYSVNKEIKNIILWSPLLDLYNNIIIPSNMFTRDFLGKQGLKKIAENGYVEFGLSNHKIDNRVFEEASYLKPVDCLYRSKSNILLLHGDKDMMIPAEQSNKIVELNSRINYVKINNGTHCFYDDTFNEVLKLTLDFLKEHVWNTL